MTATNPYKKLPEEIAFLLQHYEVPSTGQKFEESFSRPPTYFTHRVSDWDHITNSLPAILIDVNTESIQYMPYDGGWERAIPVIIMVYIHAPRGATNAESLQNDILADEEIKRVYSHLEELLNYGKNLTGITQALTISSGMILIEPWYGGDEATGVRMRMAGLEVLLRNKIR